MASTVTVSGGDAKPTSISLASPEHLLLQHPLLLGASELKLAPILARIPIQRAPKGALLSDPSLSGGFLHLVLLGLLKAYQVSAGGDELLFELVEAGSLDGLLPATGLRGHFTEAAQDSLIALVTMPALERMIAAEPRVASNLIRLISVRLAGRENHLQALALQDPKRRLAKQLLALGEATGSRHGSTITLRRLSHKTLGNMLGVLPGAIAHQLQHLAEVGTVQVTGDSFRLDSKALQQIVDDQLSGPKGNA